MTASTVALGLIWFAAFLFSTTLHEAAHALVAWRLGDPTAYHGGQVSLNPIPHMRREPFGMVIVPLLSYFGSPNHWMFGWASAPYDPTWAARHPRRSGAMALAGPLANLLLVVLSGIGIHVGLMTGGLVPPEQLSYARLVEAPGGGALGGLAALLSVFFSLNLILFLFNLLPLPPMDGSGVLQLVLPENASRSWQHMMRQPMVGILGILIAWRFFGYVISPIFAVALGLLGLLD
ncbi:MAG TPA: site-2 protease family protein [Thermoanaerobaculia bacterium]|jgi:Zn-dependent protease|nr:site-2 protease family protein [Thermoanaerobaculia bacterium]